MVLVRQRGRILVPVFAGALDARSKVARSVEHNERHCHRMHRRRFVEPYEASAGEGPSAAALNPRFPHGSGLDEKLPSEDRLLPGFHSQES